MWIILDPCFCKWWVQILYKYVQGTAWRTHASAVPISTLSSDDAFSSLPVQQDLIGANHPDDHVGVRIPRGFYRRRLCHAGVPRGNTSDDHSFHVHAGPDTRRSGRCALSGAGLCDPETATQGQSAWETPCPHG